jgi:uncharacterized protein (TIGR03083 family)
MNPLRTTSTGGPTRVIRIEDVRRIERPESTTIAATETARMAALLGTLSPEEWTRPTDCPGWDVRAMAGHVLGMAETFTGLRRFASTMRAGGKAAGDGPFIDGLTAAQVRANASLTTDEVVRRLEAAGPVQARWRSRRRAMRMIPMQEQLPDGTQETWRFGYLVDIILTRDTWMHRVDVTRATGRPMELTAGHDSRIVTDAVAEWARRHGRPFVLHLTGPIGATYVGGDGGEERTVDTLELCRILSGRGTGTGLLRQQVPF